MRRERISALRPYHNPDPYAKNTYFSNFAVTLLLCMATWLFCHWQLTRPSPQVIVVRTEAAAEDAEEKDDEVEEPVVQPAKAEPAAAAPLATLPVAATASEVKPTPTPPHDGEVKKVDQDPSEEKKAEGKAASTSATPATSSLSPAPTAPIAPPPSTTPATEPISPAVSKQPKPTTRKKAKPAATETKVSVPTASPGWIERQVGAVKVLHVYLCPNYCSKRDRRTS